MFAAQYPSPRILSFIMDNVSYRDSTDSGYAYLMFEPGRKATDWTSEGFPMI